MKILLCNDDGYQAPGICALHAALAAAPGVQVEVVAPERNNSTKSNVVMMQRERSLNKPPGTNYQINSMRSW